jgi:AcrR family transcriptional regulator
MASMSRNSDVVSTAAVELEALPPEAQAFHRRARIVDAAVREIAERGYDQVTEEAIAERAGVTSRVFHDTFSGKEEALMWAYDVAAAYAIPQILQALRAEADWARGAAAALTTYLAILDCDRAWALVCLRDVPAAGRRVRTARDVVRAPVLDALATREALPSAGGVDIEMVVTAIDGIAIDGLRYEPDQPLLARRQELATFALAPFSDMPPPADVQAAERHAPLSTEALEALLDAEGGDEQLEVLVREAAVRRDGPTLWRVVAGVQRRRAAG